MADLERQLRDYRLTTAEILYHMPDFPTVLQTFVWQHYDLAPRFPVLSRFLTYWTENLDGPLHSVRVASADLITPAEMRFLDGEFRLH
ncbi:MAG: Usg family protein [Alphaproteobacteria bacterium]|nr:Usg family protein [Alphaproteobacteria bacterium]